MRQLLIVASSNPHKCAELSAMLDPASWDVRPQSALGGAPGVRSARFAGERATDAENNAALLAALEPLAPSEAGPLTARFRCVLCLIDPFAVHMADRQRIVHGVCEGAITTAPRGTRGFGYDPLFLVQGFDPPLTFAELSDDQKAAVSHRGRAMQQLRGILEARADERRARLDRLR